VSSQAFLDWLVDGSPWEFARPVRALGDRLAEHGYTVYFEGDQRHLTKDVPEDHTPFSATGWPGRSPYPMCMATDIMPPKTGQTSKLTGRTLPSLAGLAARLRTDRMNGVPGAAWIKYMNWEPGNGACWHDSWQPDYSRTASEDRGHIHVSARSDTAAYYAADGYDLVARTEGAGVPLYGWDASHYDAVPNPATVYGEGFRFMTHKAGGDADDAELAAWWTTMRPYRGRILLGAYWVQYPGNPTGRADAFLARLDSQCPGWRDGPFILQVDCEKWGGDPATMPGLADIKAFCDRLKAKCPKLRPVVYAPKWAYGNTLAGLGYPLWASSYVTGSGPAAGLYPGDAADRWAAYSGQTPAILQFTSSATIAGQTTCDANAYRGTLEQLTALLAPGWVADMPLDSGDITAIDNLFKKYFTGTPQTDGSGTITSLAGQTFWNQGIPDGVTGKKVFAWAALLHLGSAVVASQAADAARDAALDSAINGLHSLVQQLLDVLAAGGGNLDTGAILTRLDAVKAEISLSAQAAAQAASDAVMETMRRAAHAEADAIGPPGPA
jgi:hypothetical protein